VDLHRLNHLAPCPLNRGLALPLNLCVLVHHRPRLQGIPLLAPRLPNRGRALNLCVLVHHRPRLQGTFSNSRRLALSCPIQDPPILRRLPGRNSLVCHLSNRQLHNLVCHPNQPGIIRAQLRLYVLLPLLMRVAHQFHLNLFTRPVLFQDHVKLSGMDLLWMTFIMILR